MLADTGLGRTRMGEATPTGEDPHPSQEEDHEHRESLGTVLGINVAINGILNAVSGFGLAWLFWKEYDLAWLSHEGQETFESAFIVEDLAVQGALTAVIVTVIVASILHRQWDAAHLEPDGFEAFELDGERSRGRHLVVWCVGGALASAFFGAIVAGLAVAGGEHVSGSTFAWARTANGLLVGGAFGGLVTASWVTNLAKGRLVHSGEARTVVGRACERVAGRPWVVLGLTLLAMGGLALGVTGLDTDLGPTDPLPRGNAHAEAADNVTEHLEATRGRDVVFQFRVDEGACASDAERNLPPRVAGLGACGNITDEVYVRAIEDFARYLQTYTHQPGEDLLDSNRTETVESPVEDAYGLPSFVKIANWSLAGGQGQAPDEAYSLPGPSDRGRTEATREYVDRWLAEARERTVGPAFEQATVRFAVDEDTELSRQEVGALVLEARDEYVEEASQGGAWTVFDQDNPPLHTVQTSTANAHRAELAHEDAEEFAIVAAVSLGVVLLAVLRNPATAGLVGLSATGATAATAGLTGLLGVGLSSLDMALAPIVAGISGAFGVLVVRSFADAEREGIEGSKAAALAGDRGAFPGYLASMVALFGLTTLALGPSVQVARFAGLAIAGLLFAVLATITLVPAGLALLGSARPWIGDHPAGETLPAPSKGALVALVGLVVAGAGLGVLALEDADKAGAREEVLSWPEDDELRADHVAGLEGLADTEDTLAQPGAFVVEGDLADPDALAYIDALETSLRDQANQTEGLEAGSSRTLPDAIRDWLDVCCGPQSPARSGIVGLVSGEEPDQVNSYPRSESEARDTLEAMFETPYARLAGPFVNHPGGNATVIDVRADTSEEVWTALEEARADVETDRPDDVRTSVVGAAAAEQATREDQLDWLAYAAIAAVSGAGLFAMGYTRDPTASLAFTALVGVAVLAPATAAWVLDEAISPATVLPGLLAVLATGLVGTRGAIGPNLGSSAPVERDPGGALGSTAVVAAGVLPATSWVGGPGLFDSVVEGSVEVAVLALAMAVPVAALAGWATASGVTDPQAPTDGSASAELD